MLEVFHSDITCEVPRFVENGGQSGHGWHARLWKRKSLNSGTEARSALLDGGLLG